MMRSSARDLFSDLPSVYEGPRTIAEGASLLRNYIGEKDANMVAEIERVAAISPFRNMSTPGGYRMSVAMTNCGRAGWVSDEGGYRYSEVDPLTGRSWPEMPAAFLHLAVSAAEESGFPKFDPDVCLINRYEPGARLTLHQDKDERDFGAPIVSVSLGLPARFMFGGAKRKDPLQRMRLDSGDVVVWGGPARLHYHGVAALADGEHPLTARCRYNLTFRKAL